MPVAIHGEIAGGYGVEEQKCDKDERGYRRGKAEFELVELAEHKPKAETAERTEQEVRAVSECAVHKSTYCAAQPAEHRPVRQKHYSYDKTEQHCSQAERFFGEYIRLFSVVVFLLHGAISESIISQISL